MSAKVLFEVQKSWSWSKSQMMSQCLSLKLGTRLNPSNSLPKLHRDREQQIYACHIFFIQALTACLLIGCALIILELLILLFFQQAKDAIKGVGGSNAAQFLSPSLCPRRRSNDTHHSIPALNCEWVPGGGRRNRCNWMSEFTAVRTQFRFYN